MDALFKGVREYNQTDLEQYHKLFKSLEKNQNPHTLFIGCSDSRIVPNLITKSLPGELFVIRNIANLVPYYRASDEFFSTTAAIEYAVKILNVENILICGHSNCGGCRALFADDELLNQIPHTKKWLHLSDNVRDKIKIYKKKYEPEDVEWMIEQENVVEQMNHLLTYPFVNEKYIDGRLNILGWYFEIGSGKVFNYNKETRIFDEIQ